MNDENLVNVEIDGVALKARKGAMLIEVADEAGIYIPRFCYHKKLSIAANCRMCLVEVEKAPKPLPACATPVADGMVVKTASALALEAQKGTMEFLLINHPLDCPICDQGGECELQDLAMGYGGDVSRYTEGKRVVMDVDIGPLISTDMTRCIHCTRCVRFGTEIAGIQELGATGRGEFMRIGTFIAKSVDSEMSGNVIDLCPVGALNAKPSRMNARAWELTQHASIGPHDCVGSNLFLHTLRGAIKRVVPREEESLNECWLADRDRFSYEGLNSADRLTRPMIRQDGAWRECDWETALHVVVEGLSKVRDSAGGEAIGVLVSPSATLEEMGLLRNLADQLGTHHVDHRLRQIDFGEDHDDPVYPALGATVAEVESLQGLLLIGANPRKDQPIIGHRIRKAAQSGAKVFLLNARHVALTFEAEQSVATPTQMVRRLAAMVVTAAERGGQALPDDWQLEGMSPDETLEAAVDALRDNDQAAVVLGSQAFVHPQFTKLRRLAAKLAELTGARFGYLSDGANAAGAWLTGLVPHRAMGGSHVDRVGLNALAMLRQPRKAYWLHGIEPEFDCADAATAVQALQEADFVVCTTAYVSETMRSYASVLLPVATFAETFGTFINCEGRWQSFEGAVKPPGEARPAWKVLRVLGNHLGVADFDFFSPETVRDRLRDILAEVSSDNALASAPLDLGAASSGAEVASATAMYRCDPIVRRARSLQNTRDGQDVVVRIHPDTAAAFGIDEQQPVRLGMGERQCIADWVADREVAEQCVWIPAGTETAAQLGALAGEIRVQSAPPVAQEERASS